MSLKGVKVCAQQSRPHKPEVGVQIPAEVEEFFNKLSFTHINIKGHVPFRTQLPRPDFGPSYLRTGTT